MCIFRKRIFWKCIFRKCSFRKCIFQKCIFWKCIFQKCIYPKCIFAKCTRLACLLSFASLFFGEVFPKWNQFLKLVWRWLLSKFLLCILRPGAENMKVLTRKILLTFCCHKMSSTCSNCWSVFTYIYFVSKILLYFYFNVIEWWMNKVIL